MTFRSLPFALLPLLALASGCASGGAETTSDGAAEAELRSAECPATLDVDLGAARIPSDASLTTAYTRDFAGQPDAAKQAAEQLTMVQPFLSEARATAAVSLHGTLAQACHYTTVDAATGKPNAFSMWLAKSSGSYSLRISKAMSGFDELFYNLPLTSVTTSGVVSEPSTDARLYAENTDRGHDGSDGFSVWIGYTPATLK